MAFQVTVRQSFTSHPKMDGSNENCKLWLDFCFDALAQGPIEVYWIISKGCIGNPKNFRDRVILLDELYCFKEIDSPIKSNLSNSNARE